MDGIAATTPLDHRETRRRPRLRTARWALAAFAALVLAGAAAYLGRGHLAVWRSERLLPRGDRPDVLLVTVDALRPDRLVAYGAGESRAPQLDRLASEGALALNHYTQAPLCEAAHATILTGRMPAAHGLRGGVGQMLKDGIPTVAEVFQAGGWATAAFVGESTLDGRTGLGRGFGTYADDLGEAGKRPGRAERADAAETVGRALAWAGQTRAGGAPLFLWVHFAELRLPRAAADAGPEASYDAALAGLDKELARLLEGLRVPGRELLAVVTADHADALGAHGEDSHGYFVYSATTRVPLLLSMAGRIRAGLRIAPPTRHLDLMPTLLDLVGLPAPAAVQGASLSGLLTGRSSDGPGSAPVENVALADKYGLAPLFALRSGPYLLVRGARVELFDTQVDRGEAEDAAERLVRVTAGLEKELTEWFPESARKVEAPDPRDVVDLYNRYRAAQDIEGRGDRARAIDVYRSILAENAGFVFARRRLSEALLRDKRLPEAGTELTALVDGGHATETTYLNLALVQFRLDRKDDALAWLKKGVAAFPRSAGLHHREGRVLLGLGRAEEALAAFGRAEAIEPRFADVHLARGEALEALGRMDEAKTAYGRARDAAAADSADRKAAEEALSRLSGRPAAPPGPAPSPIRTAPAGSR